LACPVGVRWLLLPCSLTIVLLASTARAQPSELVRIAQPAGESDEDRDDAAVEQKPVALTFPGMAGSLEANPNPTALEAGALGPIYITGVVSALGLHQDHAFPGDHRSCLDLSSGQLFIQKANGPVQFSVQAGIYSLPSIGTAYLNARKTSKATFGVLPQVFLKVVPSANFNLMIGKLPTLAGAEYTFSFENMNINRGLLWNQENAVNRGVQANFVKGPLTVSLSVNDGFYSKKYNWMSGLIAYTASAKDRISVVAMGNVGRTSKASFATPLLQNNGGIYNLIWTHSSGPWIVTPYLQYTRVPRNPDLGIDRSASTFGASLLARYALSPQFSLAGRAEYIASSGRPGRSTPNLLYGPGSDAWSITVTPAYQEKRFFVRGEFAFVRAISVAYGSGLGPAFNDHAQSRLAIESGFIF